MKKFLVGGAVRDMLMGVTPKDHDYVVVGSTVEEMLANGFTQVGADFPVFLKDGEEYALARREKKTGVGYLGFESEFGVDVTLEEDLGRRDLTINSISMERMEDTEFFVSGDEGHYAVFDPYGGKDDMTAKVLRHTSNAFSEDPVRVLRLARFRARFGADWSVASETKNLVHDMAKKGVLGELQAERVWKELSRALMEPFPRLFFDTLLECDALHVLFPEVYSLCSAMESRKWHPEGNAYEHTMLVLTQSALHDYDLESRLAALVHDFGKGLTKKENFPRHYGHDVNGVPVVENFCNRLTVPTKMRDRAMKATRYHMSMHKLDTLNPKTFVHMFMDMGSWNDPETVDVLYRVGVCDERGRLGSENNSLQPLDMLYTVWKAVNGVKFANVFPNGETNADKIKQGLLKARIAAASEAKK
jgi:tRNA nucleotidyltransferase (CCA-adding enzyme)